LDGEIAPDGAVARKVEAHLQGCVSCRRQVDAWRTAGEALRDVVDSGVGEVEPLLALQQIRARIACRQQSPWIWRLGAWWRDLWTFNRAAVYGVAAATALGAVSAPLFLYLFGSADNGTGPSVAAVVVESLEYGGESKAVVFRPENSSTAIIWVEPQDEPNGRGSANESH
jgi:anti-sigma factor RsiW